MYIDIVTCNILQNTLNKHILKDILFLSTEIHIMMKFRGELIILGESVYQREITH